MEEAKSRLILLGKGQNFKVEDMKIMQVERKGTINYKRIPELQGRDLEEYRSPSTTYWRIGAE